MFELILSGFQAYNQVGMLIGAAICLAIGGLLLGNALYWRVRAIRLLGTTIGVITRKGMYSAVYRYAMPDGRTYKAKSDIRTGWMRGYETGRVVPLMISASNPAKARPARSVLLEVAGVVLLIPGVLFGYAAFTAFPTTPMTLLMAAALLAYLGSRGYRAFRRNGQQVSLAEWRRRLELNEPASIDLRELKTAEEVQSSADFQSGLAGRFQQSRLARPIVGIAAVLLLAGGVYLGVRTVHLEAAGVRADGQVVSLHEEYSSDDDGGSYVYYPVVRFSTADGRMIEFKDSVGSNPAGQRVGDHVRVLFPADSAGHDAIIDRGIFWNMAMPGIAILFAVFLAWLFFALRASRHFVSPPSVGADVRRAAAG